LNKLFQGEPLKPYAVIQFFTQPNPHPSGIRPAFSLLKNGGWIWLILFSMCSTSAQADQTGKWEKLEILSKSFTKQDSLSLGLTDEEWKMISAFDQLPFPNAIHNIYKNQGSYFLMNDCELAIYTW
jgi:hypothetical protein